MQQKNLGRTKHFKITWHGAWHFGATATIFARLLKAKGILNEGFVAEWLGTALQKLLQRFEPARNLFKTAPQWIDRQSVAALCFWAKGLSPVFDKPDSYARRMIKAQLAENSTFALSNR